MPHSLRVSLVQSVLDWENPVKNRQRFTRLFSTIKKTDVIILPEMFTSGFTMEPHRVAENMPGPTLMWMQEQARVCRAAVCGSLVIREKSKFYNRFIWVSPSGDVFYYNKRHLFSMAGEHKHYSPGKEKIIIRYKEWNICPLICYDLRFPVWSRNVANQYDVLLYTANWPSLRTHAWKNLLEARAIENQCYVIGVNRVGKDGAGRTYSGNSAVHDAKGKRLTTFKSGRPGIETILLNRKELNSFRNKFPLAADADFFSLK